MLTCEIKPCMNAFQYSSHSTSIINSKRFQLSVKGPLLYQLTIITNRNNRNHDTDSPNKNIDEPNPSIPKVGL